MCWVKVHGSLVIFRLTRCSAVGSMFENLLMCRVIVNTLFHDENALIVLSI